MSTQALRIALLSAFLATALMNSGGVSAAELTKFAPGMHVHLGVTPAESLRGQPESTTHGAVPSGKGQYHIVVALFESPGGRRINNAEITAKVGEIGLHTVEKRLDPMVIANTITWGNYFQMSTPGQYRIELKIRRRGVAPADVNFDYSIPRR
ncbi:MAG: hypothetical protein A3G24_21860 [Betaproteobacteria bacterium RIFCSPLOWO2_12_FULL_62_13]|nr:MAG: hypothetical protein A3G24_21860 [Betaproteobacteria bacterium RIFCSPLOWO2_12_FULL_62_13]